MITKIHISVLPKTRVKDFRSRGLVIGDYAEVPEDELAGIEIIAIPGLGDRVASFLHRLGFSPSSGCGCEWRKQALNRFGDWFRKLF